MSLWQGKHRNSNGAMTLILLLVVLTFTKIAFAEDIIIGALDGTTKLTADDIRNGFNKGGINYIEPCANYDTYADNYVLTVVMGEYEDNLIPLKGVTVCDLLTNPASSGKYVYAPLDPRSASWDGYTGPIAPPLYEEALGGSAVGYVAGGRTTLSFWGDNDPTSNHIGGCCAELPDHAPQWYLPYRLVLFPKTDAWFFSWGTEPVVAPANALVMFEVNVWNMRSEPYNGEVTFKVTANGAETTVKSPTGRYTYIGPAPGDDMKEYAITVDLVSGPEVANTRQLKITIPTTTKLPWDVTPITGNNIPFLVHFGPMGTALGPLEKDIALRQDWFASTVVGGVAHLRPIAGHENTAQAGSLPPVTQTWTNVTSDDGIFTTNMPCKTLQYYAFSVYSATEQNIVVQYGFDTAAVVYFGEKRFVPQSFDAENTGSFALDVGQGYHQVLVKLYSDTESSSNSQSCSVTSKFNIRLLGTGVGYTHAVKPYIPEGAYELWSNSYMFYLLHLGEKEDEYVYGGLDEDFISVKTARPKEKDVLNGKTWTTLVFYGGRIPISGDNIPEGKEAAVSYVAFAIYNGYASVANVEWRFVSAGKTDVFIDGQNVYQQGFDSGSVNETFVTKLESGWHEVMVRIAAVRGQSWSLMHFIRFDNFRLGGALSPGTNLPFDVMPVRDSSYIPSLLSLRSTDNNEGAIPFDPSNTTATNDAFSDIPIDVSYKPDVLSTESIYALGRTWPFTWEALTSTTGLWGGRAYGGNFNQYWALALYATEELKTNLRITVHGGYALWLNGVLVDSKPVISQDETTHPVSLITGWHQVIVKLKANNSFHLVDTGDGKTGWTKANAVCSSAGRMQLCSRAAVCPFGEPRPGSIPTGAVSSFVPVSDQPNEWIQVFGEGGNGAALCQSWRETHSNTPPDWGESEEDLTQRRYVPCCGGNAAPSLFMSLDPPSKGELGYTYDFPLIIESVVMHIKNPLALTQIVTMTSSTTDATIQYTIGNETHTYKEPIQIVKSVTIMAQAFKDGRASRQSRLSVNVPSVRSINRVNCITSGTCPLVVTGVDPGWRIAVLTTKLPGKEISEYRDEKYALKQPASATFSGVLAIGEDNDVILPSLSTGEFFVFLYADSIPSADLVADVLKYSEISITPSEVMGTQKTLFHLQGGIRAGDVALIPLGATGSPATCDSNTCFQELTSDKDRPFTIESNGNAYINQNLYGFTGKLNCLCLCLSCAQVNSVTGVMESTLTVGKTFGVSVSIQVTSESVPTNEMVEAVRPSTVSDNTTLMLSGAFNPTGIYTVGFVQTSSVSNASITPSCAVQSVTTNSITCIMTVHAGTMGHWNVTLHNGATAVPFAATATQTLRVHPPYPSVESVTGSCAVSSVSCITGAALTFRGVNFNPTGVGYNGVRVGGLEATNPITCTVTEVSATHLACSLTVPHDKETGTFVVSLRIRTSDTVWSLEQHVGFLILGAGAEAPGWRSNTPTPQPVPEKSGNDNKATIIVGVVLGLLLLIVIIVIVVACCFCRFEPRKDDHAREMDGIEAQLLRAEEESIQSLNNPPKRTLPLTQL